MMNKKKVIKIKVDIILNRVNKKCQKKVIKRMMKNIKIKLMKMENIKQIRNNINLGQADPDVDLVKDQVKDPDVEKEKYDFI